MTRPWLADDGLLVRVRLIGGRITGPRLRALAQISEQYGDGRLHLTSRANLQIRGLPNHGGRLSREASSAIAATGLVPSFSHDLVRNVMVSPQTGLSGGRADLSTLALDLDRLICSTPEFAQLPGKFLFVLDDGRGDLIGRPCDLGFVVLDEQSAQLRCGSRWGATVPLTHAVERLGELAHDFLSARGEGVGAAWHVDELAHNLTVSYDPDPRLPIPLHPLAFGVVPGGRHVEVPESGLERSAVDELTQAVTEVVVTPWRGILVPEVQR